MPLRVEKLFQEYNTAGAFALASVLTLLALVTLIAKVLIEPKLREKEMNHRVTENTEVRQTQSNTD